MNFITQCLVFFLACSITCNAANLDQACTDDSDCTQQNSVCVYQYGGCSEGICSCQSGYYKNTGASECRPIREIGESCTDNQDCTSSTALSECDIGGTDKCQCEGGDSYKVHQETNDEGDIMKYCYLLDTGDVCTVDIQCLTHSLDSERGGCVYMESQAEVICNCETGYVLQGNKCEPASYGDNCEGSLECEDNVECLASGETETCQCPSELEYNSAYKRCHHPQAEMVSQGDACNDGYMLTSGLICPQEMVCDSCPGESSKTCQIPHDENATNLGDLCNTDSDCTTDNAQCYYSYDGCDQGECTCDYGYYEYSSIQCRQKRDIGESCDYDKDCTSMTEDSHCNSNNICECTRGAELSVYNNNGEDRDGRKYCYEFKAGQECTLDAECLSYQLNRLRGECAYVTSQNQCTCANGYNMKGEHCETVLHGENCEGSPNYECESNAICTTSGSSSTCQCGNNLKWNNEHRRCNHVDATIVQTGETCNDNYDQSNGLLCEEGDLCTSCPGENNKVCLEVNGSIKNIGGVLALVSTLLCLLVKSI